jgi:CBS domain-containing protein
VSFRLNLDRDQVQHLDAHQPLRVPPEMPVREALGLMQAQNSGCVVICRAKALAGIFTERDALRMMAGEEDFDVPIEQVMTNKPATVMAATTVDQAIKIMSEGCYRRLPMVDEAGNLIALLKVSQILRYLVEHFPQYIYNLPPAPHHTLTEREGA